MNTLDALDAQSMRTDIPDFRAGDTLKVHARVVEGNRSRIQIFQGVVIRRQGGGLRETFTIRKVSFGVGVERTYPIHSPQLDRIEIVTRGDVRRAKLYYLRDLRGKKAKIKEKREKVVASLIPPAERPSSGPHRPRSNRWSAPPTWTRTSRLARDGRHGLRRDDLGDTHIFAPATMARSDVDAYPGRGSRRPRASAGGTGPSAPTRTRAVDALPSRPAGDLRSRRRRPPSGRRRTTRLARATPRTSHAAPPPGYGSR